MVKYLINELYEVDDADASRNFGKGERREDFADAWKNTGNVILIGLEGSGRRELAELLAARSGQGVIIPDSSEAAVEALAGSGRIIVLDDALVEDPTVQPTIHGAGKVFYLVADSNTLSSRVGKRRGTDDAEQLWRDMSARLAVMEPVFYGVLHFILQGVMSPEELVEDILEKIAY